jgi:hypothetical protein
MTTETISIESGRIRRRSIAFDRRLLLDSGILGPLAAIIPSRCSGFPSGPIGGIMGPSLPRWNGAKANDAQEPQQW